MILSELRTAIYQEAGFGTSPASDVATRVLRFINEGIRTILSEPGLTRLADSDGVWPVASVASQSRYVVPEAVAQIRGISERTNDYVLGVMSLDRYRRVQPDPASQTGTPTHYVPIGRQAVAAQPGDGTSSSIYAKSTSLSDTTQTVYVEGLSAGAVVQNTATLNGTTAVLLSPYALTEISDFYLSAVGAGTITLHDDSGVGTELAAVVSYLVDYRRELTDLANATDEPPLPTDYHRILVDYVVWRELVLKSDLDRAAEAKGRYDLGLRRLKYATQNLAGELPVMGRGGRVGHSRLGPWFPADTWR
jgi:hypothetical protein